MIGTGLLNTRMSGGKCILPKSSYKESIRDGQQALLSSCLRECKLKVPQANSAPMVQHKGLLGYA